ncbi:MAG: large protein [Myxococcales bacterium]|nr:large protein [Myxococcales bacterium]
MPGVQRKEHMLIIAPRSNLLASAAFVLLSLVTGCGFAIGGGGDDEPVTTPSVLSITPTGSALTGNISISATFSEPMDPDSLSPQTFTVSSSAGRVAGDVQYADSTVVFVPTVVLANGDSYTATITTGAISARGIALGAFRAWSFTTGTPGIPVNLRTAGNYAILAKGAITTVPTSMVTGDVAVSPAAASYITGFSLTADPSNVFSTSAQVIGKVYAANYAVPTPATLTLAVNDLELAYTAAAERVPTQIDVGAGDIGGRTLTSGVYRWSGALSIPTDVTLAGSATDVWIFQTVGDVGVTAGKRITLTGGALPRNVFWQIAGSMTLGAQAHVEGIVLTKTYVTFGTGASITGRLLAQTAVTIAGSAVTQPAP